MPDLILPNGAMPKQPTALQVAAPMNDVQMLSLVAAQLMTPGMTPSQAVETALELVARAYIAMHRGRLVDVVDEMEMEQRGSSATLTP